MAIFNSYVKLPEGRGKICVDSWFITPNCLRLPIGFPLYCTSKLWDTHYLYRSVLLKGCWSCCNWSSSIIYCNQTQWTKINFDQEKYEPKTEQVANSYFLGWLRPHTQQHVKGAMYWKYMFENHMLLEINVWTLDIIEQGGRMPPCMWRSSLYTGRWQNFGHLMQTQPAFHHPT
jgi:hypothetical protein